MQPLLWDEHKWQIESAWKRSASCIIFDTSSEWISSKCVGIIAVSSFTFERLFPSGTASRLIFNSIILTFLFISIIILLLVIINTIKRLMMMLCMFLFLGCCIIPLFLIFYESSITFPFIKNQSIQCCLLIVV